MWWLEMEFGVYVSLYSAGCIWIPIGISALRWRHIQLTSPEHDETPSLYPTNSHCTHLGLNGIIVTIHSARTNVRRDQSIAILNISNGKIQILKTKIRKTLTKRSIFCSDNGQLWGFPHGQDNEWPFALVSSVLDF